ncbi:KTSC domain-containing protein, partial [Dysosmobacter welbionis]
AVARRKAEKQRKGRENVSRETNGRKRAADVSRETSAAGHSKRRQPQGGSCKCRTPPE